MFHKQKSRGTRQKCRTSQVPKPIPKSQVAFLVTVLIILSNIAFSMPGEGVVVVS